MTEPTGPDHELTDEVRARYQALADKTGEVVMVTDARPGTVLPAPEPACGGKGSRELAETQGAERGGRDTPGPPQTGRLIGMDETIKVIRLPKADSREANTSRGCGAVRLVRPGRWSGTERSGEMTTRSRERDAG